eukprot:m.591616 g.591616  ORF g.591616 m.591616 type:complete len:106 (+) comp22381_c0_seq4:382-699(+)
MELADVGDVGGLWEEDDEDSGDDHVTATPAIVESRPKLTARNLSAALPAPNAPFRLGVRVNKVFENLVKPIGSIVVKHFPSNADFSMDSFWAENRVVMLFLRRFG